MYQSKVLLEALMLLDYGIELPIGRSIIDIICGGHNNIINLSENIAPKRSHFIAVELELLFDPA